MKKLFTFALLAATAMAASAQYLCTEKGTVMKYETKTADEDGKAIELTVTTTIVDVTTAADGVITVKTEQVTPIPGNDFGKVTEYSYAKYNPADNTTTEIEAGEEDSKASIVNFIKTSAEAAGQSVSASQIEELEKSIKVKGEIKLELKPGIEAGTKIENQTLRLSIGPETMVMNLWEAQYCGYESITVPAGTYECIKLSFVKNMKMGTNKQKTYITAWYAEGIGLVKQVSADKKGNESSVTELKEVKVP